ncbi:EAL domain-containing protein [Pseudomonas sp. JS3066]|jgi:diguanylate cyclase (GGDEF)-like protein/PAS domain S-box-containing protein|uniref:putative bifunctional diguanylate cyclase/phosphodiesterase n=1 Tax=unclassified Pseudomonas TaxID=196821 RepID=UPI000EA869CE|nr:MULTISPECIES: EAL domain-containing protein [unclassified Pseudomonas]AYF86553.1 EAL domain-containing protein [Pseudomonas sp. DY-1]MDH4654710.1 EAL domain-containing protein [Pseudomonas sp. BN606]MRK23905.1 EAL domain-containing protein [Pseudomonas sp. JG-B]WVK95981.1 EAL domain-containing protein [Pseudomonas sp. JS3066]
MDSFESESAANQVISAHSNNQPTTRWHRMYFFLAGFDVLVVVLSVLLNHLIVDTYHRSIKANQSWVQQLSAYSTLGSLASEVNAPGNNVFDTHDVEAESQNMTAALRAFDEHLANAKQQLEVRIANQAEHSADIQAFTLALKGEVAEVDSAMVEMVKEATLIFSFFREGKSDEAGKRMATMDRKYAKLLASLAAVRERVGLIQSKLLEEELESVEELRRIEYAIMVFVLLMVTAAVFYGRRIRREMESHAAEREGYLSVLRESERQFRQQASLLDKAQDAIVVHDMDHRILYWNRSAERLYGLTRDEALGMSAQGLIYPSHAPIDTATHSLIELGDWSGEVTLRRRDGSTINFESHRTLVRDDNGLPQSVLSINTDISHRKAAEQEVKRLAFYDQLTGLANRRLMLDRLQHALASSARSQHTSAVILIDLDNFKALNDTLGHDRGDMLLQQVAHRLSACIRESDTVARLGGDEFVVLLEGLSENPPDAAIQAKTICEKILSSLNLSYPLDGYEHHSTPSLGIALFQGQLNTVDDIMKRADLAMYRAKAAGRNTMRFFDPEMQAVATARARLESDLRQGLQSKELSLHFQPQVNSQGRIVGAEALMRWQHPERGNVLPADFIPLAEETGLILPLGRWALQTACAQLTTWAKHPETARLVVAVNVSARQFHHPDFVEEVLTVLRYTGADPRRLKLELTEGLLVEDMENTVAKMIELKEIGIGLSLDDFGTGYSSLSYLKSLPLDQLKIDKSFIRDVLVDPNDAAIACAIVSLSQILGLSVIAEGVETEAQRAFLVSHGCHTYQGNLFSRPLPAEQFKQYVHERSMAEN